MAIFVQRESFLKEMIFYSYYYKFAYVFIKQTIDT